MINPIQNGESGLSARTKLNQAISKVNYSGAQLLGSASVNLNLPTVPLTHPRLSYSGDINNAKLTYTSGTGSFTLYEYVTDNNSNVGIVFYNSASTMSIAYIQATSLSPFAPGVGFTGSISNKKATVVTSVSNSLLTPDESIKSLDSSSATVVTSQSGSGIYFANSEITSVTGSFTVSFLDLGLGLGPNPWIPGETINDTTSGASAKLIYQNNNILVVKSVTGSFVTGDTIVGSLSSNSNGLVNDLTVGYGYNVVVGQTSKVAFPIDNYFTSSYTDTTITLSGGSTFVVTDVLMTNGVGTFVSASEGPYLYTSQSQDGTLIAYGTLDVGDLRGNVPGAIHKVLTSPNNYVNNIGYLNDSVLAGNVMNPSVIGIILPNHVTVGSTLYCSNTPNTSAATADVYVYGYILS